MFISFHGSFCRFNLISRFLHQSPDWWRSALVHSFLKHTRATCQKHYQAYFSIPFRITRYLWLLPLRSCSDPISACLGMGRINIRMEKCYRYWSLLWICRIASSLPDMGILSWRQSYDSTLNPATTGGLVKLLDHLLYIRKHVDYNILSRHLFPSR